jgi:hypothetical protein
MDRTVRDVHLADAQVDEMETLRAQGLEVLLGRSPARVDR